MSSDRALVAGRYRLESVLGEGGMGTVWTGRDELLGRRVAVKEVRIPLGLSDRDRDVLHERMMREARLTARLNDSRVVTVYDVVLHDDRPYIVMELVPSRSLDQVLDESGPLPPQRVAEIGIELLAALDLAHREGIVHRDVKPSNVLLADDGRVVLTDFGIATTESDATLTSTGVLVGSPTYMSPERLRGEHVGSEADMWSLGATLYAALEAHPPFRSSTTMGTITAVLTNEVPPSRAPGALGDALLGMLRKEPTQRLASPQVRALLQQAVGQPSGATATIPAPVPVMAPAVGPAYVWATEPLDDPRVDVPRVDDPRGMEPEPASEDSGRRSRSVALLIGLAVLAVIVGGIVGVILTGSDDGAGTAADGPSTAAPDGTGKDRSSQDPSTTPSSPATSDPSPSPSSEPTEGETDTAKAPKGFRMVRDPLDFSVAVPKGWQRRLNSATAVDFQSPDGSQYLRIEQVAEAGDDAEQAWLDQEPGVEQRLPGYQRISIAPVDYRWSAADWEFTFEASGGTIHVLNRGFITDPRGFAIYMSAPDAVWESEGLPVFETAAATFEPTV